MIISTEYKFVMVHIPKTGGTTIADYFRRNARFNKTVKVYYYIDKNGNDMAHTPCKEIHRFIPDYPNTHNAYKWYTFARNPYDRIYSTYQYLVQPHTRPPRRRTKVPLMSFEEFLASERANPGKYGVHSLPMTAVCDADDIRNHNVTVFRTEHFDEDFRQFLSAHNLATQFAPANVLNARFDSPFRYEHIYEANPHLIPIVNNMFAEDFRTYGYKML